MSCAPDALQEKSCSTPVESVDVLFIIDQLCELGGAEKVFVRMIERLPRDRYSPTAITFKIDHRLGIAESISCPLHVFPLRRTYDWDAAQVARKIGRIVRNRRIQITHTFHETSDLWAGPIAKLSGCPVLVSSRRDMGFNRGAKHRLPYRLLRGCFDQVQTVSEQVRTQNITADRLNPSRVLTIYNGVDIPQKGVQLEKDLLRGRLGLKHATHLVTSVGHIRSIKGFDVLLRAAVKVREQMDGVVFAIAGDDHEPAHTAELKGMVAALGMQSHFLFLGAMSDVRALLSASDVFCLLSRTEGLSNALLEAMAYELPCIATAVGGNPEVVATGRTGYLVENEDASAASTRIAELLRDPVKARAMGREGRRVVEEKFTTEIMMERVLQSYEQLLSAARRRNS